MFKQYASQRKKSCSTEQRRMHWSKWNARSRETEREKFTDAIYCIIIIIQTSSAHNEDNEENNVHRIERKTKIQKQRQQEKQENVRIGLLL